MNCQDSPKRKIVLGRQERGAILPMIAATVAVFLLVIAFMGFVGQKKLVKSEAQKAVDAAALAGAAALHNYANSGNDNLVDELARSFNSGVGTSTNWVGGNDPAIARDDVIVQNYNFSTGELSTPLIPLAGNAVTVTKVFPMHSGFLSGLSGVSDSQVQVSATALMGGVSCATPRLPLALFDCQFEALSRPCEMNCFNPAGCTNCTSKMVMKEHWSDNSAWFATEEVDFDDNNPDNPNSSARDCKDNIQGGYPTEPDRTLLPKLCAGEIVGLNRGVVAACHHEIDDWCAPAYRNCSPSNPWVVDVPIIACSSFTVPDSPRGRSNWDVPVAGFARIGVTHIDRHAKEIHFQFICPGVVPGSVGGGIACGAQDYMRAEKPILVR